MKTENTNEAVDSTELAKDAISYALERIRDDENIRYHMGFFTEAFERLKTAHSALTGISPEAIEESISDRVLTREPFAIQVKKVKEVIDGLLAARPTERHVEILKIASILGMR